MAIRITTAPELGPRVTLADIVGFAQKSCNLCVGKGFLTVIGTEENPTDKTKKRTEPCGCALSRFMRKTPGILVDDHKSLFWPKDGPAAAMAPAEKEPDDNGNGAADVSGHHGERLQEKLTHLMRDRGELVDEISAMRAKNDAAVAPLETEKAELNKRLAAVAKLSDDKAALAATFEQESTEHIEREIRRLHEQISDLRALQQEKRKSAVQLRQQAEATKPESDKLFAEVRDAEKRISAKRGEKRKETRMIQNKLDKVQRRIKRTRVLLGIGDDEGFAVDADAPPDDVETAVQAAGTAP